MSEAAFAWTVITGASSGIGAAIARALARQRQSLVLVGRDRGRLEAVADDCRSLGASEVRVAVADQRDRPRTAAELAAVAAEAPIALFVACAGILDGRGADEIVETGATAHAVLDVNLLSTVDTLHMVLPGMIERGEGGIVLVASLAAFAPLPDAPAYSASKAGLLSYGLALREAVRGHGVRVTVACPGYVETAMTETHIGPQPGRIGADEAADRILDAHRRDRATTAFPFPTGFSSRLAMFAPEFALRLVMRGLRFHIERTGGGRV